MPTRREREKEERQKYILEKAQGLFAQKGYIGTSMAEIAEASEFAVGSLYSFFNSKEEILTTIFQEHIQQVLGEVQQIRDDRKLSIRQKIEACLEKLVRIYVENQDFFRIYVAESRGVEWGVRSEVGEHIFKGSTQYMEGMAALFSEGIETGVIHKGLNPDFLALLLRSFIHSTVNHFLYSGRDYTVDELLLIAKRVLFFGIMPDGESGNGRDSEMLFESEN